MYFLRYFFVFCAVFSVSHQVSVFNETPNISETDQCQMSCGTKGQLPLTEIDGGFYYFYFDETNKKSWHEAYDFCRQHNMELATIESAAENEAIKQNINGIKPSEGCFIGLNDLAKKGEFRWASTGRVPTFTDWHQGEPNKLGDEQCGEFWMHDNIMKWNNLACSHLRERFICEVTSKNLLYMHVN